LPAAMGIGVEGICDGGHLVIVDGYNTDNYFHLNFGWGQDLPDTITEAWYLMPYEIPANFQQIKEIFYNIRNVDSSQPALMITPEQDLYLYSRSNEYSAIKSFDISNNGTEPITIHSIQSSHSGIKIGISTAEFYDELSDIDIQPGQTIPFYVQLYSESSGIIEGDIIIQTINNQYQHVHCIGYTAPAAGTLITPENNLLTWSAGSSPYYVCGCVEIANSQTLVINPGTRIISFPNSSLVVTEGGALQAVGSENALIEFTAYDASLGWWGIDFMQTSGDNILAFCSISHGRADGLTTSNKSGGAVFCQNSRVTIHHCTIQNNWCFYEGGGIFASGGEMVIANNAISDNSSKLYTGGGMCIISGCNHEIHGNSLFNNSSDKGGGGISLFSGQKVEFNNNLIYNNTAAGSGGGVFLSGGYPFDINYLFCNNTIANNQATRGGGIYAELRTSMILKNSIIWGNQASSGYSLAISRNNNDLCSITLEYSNIDTVNSNWLSWPGNRDFSLWHEIRSTEPAFSDPVYHLSTGSPCIDMGNPNDDVDQEHFPHGYRINIGAYGGTAEAQVTTTPVLAAVPNPLQFGAVHYEENKQVEMFLKNGCFQALCIHDMVLEDTSVFSLYAVNHEPIQYPFTVSSGGIYACSIIFYPQGTVSKNYCSALYITYENDQMISIQITAEQVGGTIISTSTLSGHLNFKQSPYYIINDVRVNQDAELIIDPGVQLIFKNDSQMIVDYSAVISAIGTEEDSIVFCAFDPSIGWRGIDMTNTGLPEDEKQPHQFHYCIFRDCNSTAIEAEVPVSIQDCLFEDNTVSIGPAALLLWNNDYFVKNNVFKNNRSPLAGGVFAFFGEIGKINVFEGNAFINNSGTEAGAVLINGSTETGSPLIMMDNLFSGNESEGGGAIVIDAKNSDLEVLLLENTISDNISPNGSGILLRGTNTAYHPSPLYVRCQGNLIVSNSPGSAILCRDRVTLELVNNTIADNYSNGANALAAVYNNVSNHPSIQIKNNIIWGNDDEYGRIFSFQNMSPDSITIAYTAIDTSSSDSWYGDVTWGYGNIFNNPIFLDTLNYMLDNDSPCIDAGSPDQVYNDIEDPENPGYAQWPALGTCRNDMGRYGGPGAAEYITDVVDRSLNFHGIPDGLALFQNYPNPFNPITTIHYQLPNDCHVVLKIFNMLGQEVTTLVDAKQRPGYYDIQWDADQNVSGLYFYYFRAESNNGQSVETMKKMLLLK
jgi:hypothetical protein